MPTYDGDDNESARGVQCVAATPIGRMLSSSPMTSQVRRLDNRCTLHVDWHASHHTRLIDYAHHYAVAGLRPPIYAAACAASAFFTTTISGATRATMGPHRSHNDGCFTSDPTARLKFQHRSHLTPSARETPTVTMPAPVTSAAFVLNDAPFMSGESAASATTASDTMNVKRSASPFVERWAVFINAVNASSVECTVARASSDAPTAPARRASSIAPFTTALTANSDAYNDDCDGGSEPHTGGGEGHPAWNTDAAVADGGNGSA